MEEPSSLQTLLVCSAMELGFAFLLLSYFPLNTKHTSQKILIFQLSKNMMRKEADLCWQAKLWIVAAVHQWKQRHFSFFLFFFYLYFVLVGIYIYFLIKWVGLINLTNYAFPVWLWWRVMTLLVPERLCLTSKKHQKLSSIILNKKKKDTIK